MSTCAERGSFIVALFEMVTGGGAIFSCHGGMNLFNRECPAGHGQIAGPPQRVLVVVVVYRGFRAQLVIRGREIARHQEELCLHDPYILVFTMLMDKTIQVLNGQPGSRTSS